MFYREIGKGSRENRADLPIATVRSPRKLKIPLPSINKPQRTGWRHIRRIYKLAYGAMAIVAAERYIDHGTLSLKLPTSKGESLA